MRTYAAAALAALPERSLYGPQLTDALLVVAGALEALEGSGGGGAPAAGGSAGGSSGGSSGLADGPGSSGADGGGDGAGGEEGSRSFPNFRYRPGLLAQLRCALLHLLALARAGDGARAREGCVCGGGGGALASTIVGAAAPHAAQPCPHM